ncbi:M56 family metallopeptidase [Gulosibacter sp. 10]|uniref:M56 family metallopeptidase n=1 Tax=Gulosibacter sp. 10 TaxID=1255570 RepID=UPI00097EADAB|nr:M56 family metallopeptidase [Gulosibacter sp. 10]SJM64378.1 Peptidase M48, Ste24p precursor [Gulosibacter sp. 10]
MTPGALALAVAAGLLGLALAGPWLLRRSAPALVRVPRLAIGVISAGVLSWLGAVLALGPMLAWSRPGPALLPEGMAEICEQCLAAASPFGGPASASGVPAVLLLAVPALAGLLLLAGVVAQLRARNRKSRESALALLRSARPRLLHGCTAWVADTDLPIAVAFPARHGGIVVSSGLLERLDEEELIAVLAHEEAHLRQRHHLIDMMMASIAAHLRWVPFVRAAADALPHYFEIAADDRSRQRVGTPALVSALLKIGERSRAEDPSRAAMHAAGPERIRQLVQPSSGRAGILPTSAVALGGLSLAIAAVAVHLTYVAVAINGC